MVDAGTPELTLQESRDQDPLEDLPELDTITGVSQGFIPEGLFFWRRWRHPEPA